MKMRSDIYAAAFAFMGGVGSWLHEVGIDQAFTGLIIKTIIIALVSTMTGLIVKRAFYWLFPLKDVYKDEKYKK